MGTLCAYHIMALSVHTSFSFTHVLMNPVYLILNNKDSDTGQSSCRTREFCIKRKVFKNNLHELRDTFMYYIPQISMNMYYIYT